MSREVFIYGFKIKELEKKNFTENEFDLSDPVQLHVQLLQAIDQVWKKEGSFEDTFQRLGQYGIYMRFFILGKTPAFHFINIIQRVLNEDREVQKYDETYFFRTGTLQKIFDVLTIYQCIYTHNWAMIRENMSLSVLSEWIKNAQQDYEAESEPSMDLKKGFWDQYDYQSIKMEILENQDDFFCLEDCY